MKFLDFLKGNMTSSMISAETARRIGLLFPESARQEVTNLMIEQCGNNLPFLEKSSPVELERVRFAALKLSGSNIEKLRETIRLAKDDWRDLLVAAGFADDREAHHKWLK